MYASHTKSKQYPHQLAQNKCETADPNLEKCCNQIYDNQTKREQYFNQPFKKEMLTIRGQAKSEQATRFRNI